MLLIQSFMKRKLTVDNRKSNSSHNQSFFVMQQMLFDFLCTTSSCFFRIGVLFLSDRCLSIYRLPSTIQYLQLFLWMRWDSSDETVILLFFFFFYLCSVLLTILFCLTVILQLTIVLCVRPITVSDYLFFSFLFFLLH